jgi:hypothetical protein
MDKTSLSCVRVRHGAIPSIFEAFPSYLKKTKPVRKAPKLRISAEPIFTTTSVINDDFSNMCASLLPMQDKFQAAATGDETPRKVSLNQKLCKAERSLAFSRKKIKLLQQRKRRLARRNASLKNVISALERNKVLDSESLYILQKSAGGIGDLLRRQFSKCLGKSTQQKFSPELRSFALTLHFYSPHAYRYVRKMFNTCLPHPRTIEKWFQTVDCKPGFTADSFTALQRKVSEMAKKNKNLLCALMMDEVAIRHQVEWDGKKYQGYIDYGTDMDDDSLPLAKEALTFMVVAMNDSFKLPIAYFLIDGLTGKQRANLVRQCLTKLHNIGVTVGSLTCDGLASNFSMAKYLKCNTDSADFKAWFQHPETKEQVVLFFDPCHMLKLVRNTLGDKKSLVDGQGQFVKWEYIEKLHQLQENEGLHLGNKLRSGHLQWFKKKMNVNLAAQLLSESVASSLEFCLKCGIAGFENCQPTIKFIRVFNGLFDILTSRNLCSKGLKAPLQEKNLQEITCYLQQSKQYISTLRESLNGKPLLETNRKTGIYSCHRQYFTSVSLDNC